MPCQVLNWESRGLVDYAEAHAHQQALVAARADDAIPDTLLLVAHPHTFTLGRRGRGDSRKNVLAAGEVPVLQVERGGDVTYHGPGQLVAYPIFRLGAGERDAPGFIRRLEAWVIAACRGLDVNDLDRSPGFSGVWTGPSWARRGLDGKKLASVGVAVTASWVTWHGIAVNVTTDLAYFARIQPCGLRAEVMTSLEQLTGRALPLPRLATQLVAALPECLGRKVHAPIT